MNEGWKPLDGMTEEEGKQLLRMAERQNARARKTIVQRRRKMIIIADNVMNRHARRAAKKQGK